MKKKVEYAIFARNLSMVYDQRKKERLFTNAEDLLKMINEKETVIKDVRSFQSYKAGEQYPRKKAMKAICRVLRTTEEELNSAEPKELYKSSKAYTEQLHEESAEYADSIGLSPDFLNFIRAAIPDQHFPLYLPVRWILDPDPVDLMKARAVRATPAAAYDSKSKTNYQLHLSDGKTVNLSKADLQFINDVQKEVVGFIEYLYYRRKKEMDDILDRMNADQYETAPDGWTITKAVDEIDFDKYAQYVQENQ